MTLSKMYACLLSISLSLTKLSFIHIAFYTQLLTQVLQLIDNCLKMFIVQRASWHIENKKINKKTGKGSKHKRNKGN